VQEEEEEEEESFYVWKGKRKYKVCCDASRRRH
jgi:hypothetical protein